MKEAYQALKMHSGELTATQPTEEV